MTKVLRTPEMAHLALEEHRFRLDRALHMGDDIRGCQAAVGAAVALWSIWLAWLRSLSCPGIAETVQDSAS
ncbi:uncharacterized protein METZ01_LOCUS222962 [marine metagenome]|uniref:Uncharacterized protein n=1 Tax=marine metagenome TaxID=408172 RepID=A0A382G4B2_9ZZZZ